MLDSEEGLVGGAARRGAATRSRRRCTSVSSPTVVSRAGGEGDNERRKRGP